MTCTPRNKNTLFYFCKLLFILKCLFNWLFGCGFVANVVTQFRPDSNAAISLKYSRYVLLRSLCKNIFNQIRNVISH